MTDKIPKTTYYTTANIDQQARKFLDQLQPLTARHSNQKLIPNKAALLVIDMQKFFFDPEYHAFVPSMPAIVPKIKQLQDLFLQHELTVFQTKHGNTSENCGQMLNWWGSINDANDPLAEIIPELQNPTIEVINKTQYDAFWNSDLAERLAANNITQIIITGVMTHLCCETTARTAFVRGFEVFFAIDGTATYNEDFHCATLLNLAHGFAVPILIDEIKEKIL